MIGETGGQIGRLCPAIKLIWCKKHNLFAHHGRRGRGSTCDQVNSDAQVGKVSGLVTRFGTERLEELALLVEALFGHVLRFGTERLESGEEMHYWQ